MSIPLPDQLDKYLNEIACIRGSAISRREIDELKELFTMRRVLVVRDFACLSLKFEIHAYQRGWLPNVKETPPPISRNPTKTKGWYRQFVKPNKRQHLKRNNHV